MKIDTVMLIDDEEIDQKSYQRVLKRSGLVENTLTFTYADDALSYLKTHPDRPVDVIFLDINMPRMNGFEFLEAACKELREDFDAIIVVMLTTSLNPDDKIRADSNPLVRRFLNKPLTLDMVSDVAGLLSDERFADN